MGTGKTVGTVGGAAIGTAVGGPVGTVIGGYLGGAVGGLFDKSSAPPPPDPTNFQYGAGNGSQGAQQAADTYNQKGDAADALGANYRGQQNLATSTAYDAQGRAAPQLQANEADRQRQLAALGGTTANAQQLTAMGTAPTNTNIAASQLAQGQQANAAQNLAMASSGRSIGGGAASMQQAQFNNAASNQVTNQQAATANLQEQQQNKQMQIQALGGAQNAYGQAGQQAAGLNASDVGLQASNAQLAQGQQQVNNQTTQTFGQMGSNFGQQGLGEQGVGQGYSQMGKSVMDQQLAANQNLASLSQGGSIAAMNNQNVQTGMYLQGASALAGAASDRDAKTDIKKEGDDDKWYSPLISYGALGRALGIGGSHGAVPAAVPPAQIQDPHNPSRMISPYASIGAASHGAMGQRANANAMGGAMQMADSPDARAKANIAALGGYAPATQDTWGGGAPVVAPDAGPAPAPWLQNYMAQQQGPQPDVVASDVHSKSRIEDLSKQNAALTAALQASQAQYQPIADASRSAHSQYVQTAPTAQGAAYPGDAPPSAEPAVDLRPAQPYSYSYKDPARHGYGRFVGPMAQDLEKTPAGATVVKRAPDGTKMVDTSRLALVNTGAISDMQRRQQQQQAQIAALGGQQAGTVDRYQQYLQGQR